MSRHAQRYPTKSAGTGHLEFLERVKNTGLPLNGSLAFLNNWTYFTDDPSRDFGQLTRTGPHPGTLAAVSSGVEYLARYGHLISREPTRVWASGSQRVIDTARHFASGFFGPDWESSGKAELQIIPETFERGADTLTPSKTCQKYLDDKDRHDHGANMLARFQSVYIRKIANRLIGEGNSGLGVLTNYEVFSMQEMCGSETMVRGSSPWCDVFTEQDWDNFEYARDLRQFYRAGPGNSYAGAMGWLWLDATTTLLNDGPEVGTLFLSFAHSGDIARLLTALGAFDGEPHLPTTHVVHDRTWRTSSVMPMGARITFERLTCSSTDTKAYVRVNINDRIVPLPSCRSGPGGSCPLDEFVDYVRQRKEEVGDFGEVCDLNGKTGSITFLHHD
ncbi:hypothetical protein N7474_002458 [Penicillium riverlandense]|uniref:uncharacterized protein n=1 Tax=Penicillium riverlandense TaxID=1903569 RepID=UPI002546AE23|nr:uncharacterized protein N7474_002458 [Penicillium riverlandense]KAJ5825320.1 hypothetical protein N7474_002458 [Penicillium riverlandense]